MEESETYSIYTEVERSELLFNIFIMVVVGGHLNQYEDYLIPYRDATRELYKHLVSVRKDYSNDQMFVDTFVYSIKSVDGAPVFRESHPQNYLFVVVQPFTKVVTIMRHEWQYFG